MKEIFWKALTGISVNLVFLAYFWSRKWIFPYTEENRIFLGIDEIEKFEERRETVRFYIVFIFPCIMAFIYFYNQDFFKQILTLKDEFIIMPSTFLFVSAMLISCLLIVVFPLTDKILEYQLGAEKYEMIIDAICSQKGINLRKVKLFERFILTGLGIFFLKIFTVDIVVRYTNDTITFCEGFTITPITENIKDIKSIRLIEGFYDKDNKFNTDKKYIIHFKDNHRFFSSSWKRVDSEFDEEEKLIKNFATKNNITIDEKKTDN